MNRILLITLGTIFGIVAIFSMVVAGTLMTVGTNVIPVMLQKEIKLENIVEPKMSERGEVTYTFENVKHMLVFKNDDKWILVTPEPVMPVGEHNKQQTYENMKTGFLQVISGSNDTLAGHCQGNHKEYIGTYINSRGFSRPHYRCK